MMSKVSEPAHKIKLRGARALTTTGTPSTRCLLDGATVQFSPKRANFGARGRVVRRLAPGSPG